VAVQVQALQLGRLGLVKEWIALVIMALVLIGLAFEVAHRTWVAFMGSFAMLGQFGYDAERMQDSSCRSLLHSLIVLAI
jgi:hypothetical protein